MDLSVEKSIEEKDEGIFVSVLNADQIMKTTVRKIPTVILVLFKCHWQP